MLSEQQQQFIDDAPLLYQRIISDALEGNCPRSRAIKAMCLSCSGFVRDEVRNCTVITCPLHAFRPYTKHQLAIDDEPGEEHDDSEGA